MSDFVNAGCLPFAKADDVLNVTGRLNGGTIGLAQRQQWLAKWKAALGAGPVDLSFPTPGVAGVIPRSPTGFDDIPKPPEIKLPKSGQTPPPQLAPTFWGRVTNLFKPKAT